MELSDSISTWRISNNVISPGRPSSFTDLDFVTPRSSYHMNSQYSINEIETTLDSSKEDISCRTSNESDSLSLLEHESSTHSSSPVLPSLKSHASVSSISSNGLPPKRPANPSPPQLKTSVSFNSRLANSPSISRLQDETSSNISRNSSIDSGIQFASEAENGSANGLEVIPPATATVELSEDTADVRKSVGFADDIFAALGMK